jgi:hypothetical protein
LRRQTGGLVRDIEGGYAQTANERTKLLRQKITLGSSFKLIFGRKNQERDVHSGIETRLSELMQPQINKAVSALETDLRSLWPQMQDLLDNQLSADLRKEARSNIPDFAGQRRELHEAIQRAFLEILTGKALQERLARSHWLTSVAMRISAALTLIGGVAAVVLKTQNVSIAIGAGIAAGLGLLCAIFLAFTHRRKILGDYERELDPKRSEFKQALELQFGKAIDSFCVEMAKRFQSLSDICQKRRARYDPWSNQIADLQTKFAAAKPRLG